MNSQNITLLILWDLRALFDTVDHGVVLERLSDEGGVHGTAVSWF